MLDIEQVRAVCPEAARLLATARGRSGYQWPSMEAVCRRLLELASERDALLASAEKAEAEVARLLSPMSCGHPAACVVSDPDEGTCYCGMCAEVERLRAIIAATVPFLEEAWAACFDGKQEALLSAEQRGMGHLLSVFRAIVAGKPALPPGLISCEDAEKMVESALAWAHKLLGNPNEVAPELARWLSPGNTCADGLRMCNAEVERLRAELEGKSNADTD